jgi:hypothetical protein
MSKAYVCSISGKVAGGEGVKVLTVLFSKRLKGEVRFFELESGAYIQGEVSPEEAKKVETALLNAVKPMEPAVSAAAK